MQSAALVLLPALALISGAAAANSPSLFTIVGAAGTAEYQDQFDSLLSLWKEYADQAGATHTIIGDGEPEEVDDRARLQSALESEAKDGWAPLWIILLGHGTFDGAVAKFNLRGPDVSADELKQWLAPFSRPLILVNAASSSSPFLTALSSTNRVILTSTKSGFEQNYARFGDYFTRAIGELSSDLDKDGQTSLLEAFLVACRNVAEFYELEGRLATEHALIDDNGDGLGTPEDWFRGIRAVKKATEGGVPDGFRAHQIHLLPNDAERLMPQLLRARRDAIELALAQLREEKTQLSEADYYAKLEPLLIELAKLYRESARSPSPPPAESATGFE